MQYFVFGFHFGKLHCTGTGLKSISICLGAVLIHLFYQIGQLFGAPKHYLQLHLFGSFKQNLNMYIEFKINSEKTLTCKNIKIYYLGCSHSYSGMFLSRLFILPFSTVNCMRMLVIEDKVAIYINSNHFNFLYAVVYRKVLSIDLSKTKTGTKQKNWQHIHISSSHFI